MPNINELAGICLSAQVKLTIVRKTAYGIGESYESIFQIFFRK